MKNDEIIIHSLKYSSSLENYLTENILELKSKMNVKIHVTSRLFKNV